MRGSHFKEVHIKAGSTVYLADVGVTCSKHAPIINMHFKTSLALMFMTGLTVSNVGNFLGFVLIL